MLTTTQFRIFCLPISSLKIGILKHKKLQFYLLLCMAVKLGLSHYEKKTDWGCLSRIFGPKLEEVEGGWRRLHNEELHDLYTSPNIIRVIKSKRLKWVGHIACMGEIRMHTKFLSEYLKGRDHSEYPNVDGKIILECILRKQGGRM
jgi:hypothetical protein